MSAHRERAAHALRKEMDDFQITEYLKQEEEEEEESQEPRPGTSKEDPINIGSTESSTGDTTEEYEGDDEAEPAK